MENWWSTGFLDYWLIPGVVLVDGRNEVINTYLKCVFVCVIVCSFLSLHFHKLEERSP